MTMQLSLADTIPPMKQCRCGAAYDAEAWARLEYVGVQDAGDGERYERRNCTCSRTIAIELERAPAATSDLGHTPAPPRARATWPIPPGTPRRSCRSCAAIVFWIETSRGRKMPLDPDGTSHFATCPDAAHHRKPRSRSR